MAVSEDDEVTSGKIEIVLPGGVKINVVSPVKESELATVLAAVGGGRC